MSEKTLPIPEERNLFFSKQVDQESIENLSKEIIKFNEEDEYLKKLYSINDLEYKSKPIKIFIDSYGGEVYSCFGLIGIMETSKTPIYTYACGATMSCGFLILICGHKRFSYPLATPLYHEISCWYGGKLSDMESELKETKRLQKELEDIIFKKTKITKEKLKDVNKQRLDWFMSPKEALDLGVVDEIITTKETVK